MQGKSRRIFWILLAAAFVLVSFLLCQLPVDGASYAEQILTRCGLGARAGEDVHKLVFLDVGQGDCALLMSDGQVALIDTGTGLDDGLSLVRELRQQGVTSIDYLLLSHPHNDHIGGAAALLDSFPVRQIYCTFNTPKDSADAFVFDHLQSAAAAVDVPFSDYPASSFAVGHFTVEPLYRDDFLPDENDRSQFLKVSGFDFTAIFTGDCGSAAETSLLHSGLSVSADLLKIGHHGSGSSTSEAFLAAVQPRFAVISVGENTYGHPADAVLDRLSAAGCEVFRTDVNGKITFDFSETCTIRSER